MKYERIPFERMLQNRVLSDGGFSEAPGGDFRPDATAWAALALAGSKEPVSRVDLARRRLSESQRNDGRVSIAPNHPEAFWPTAIAILAWQGDPGYQSEQTRAVRFLLDTTGRHWPKQADAPLGHDTAIRGWPWVTDTHSWVEPTALVLCALAAAGERNHPRVAEGAAMLLDRQLPKGGWNYGNTLVYGRELQAMPDATGLALHALAGRVPRSRVEKSLAWLATQTEHLTTPFSLAWSLLGLGAWGMRPADAEELIDVCLRRQERYGDYPTSHLCLLLLALCAPEGLLNLFSENMETRD